jgi:hypothetical protein
MKTKSKTFVKVARPVFDKELVQLETTCAQSMINKVLLLIGA